MRFYKLFFVLTAALTCTSSYASDFLDSVAKNIQAVCDKPENAGSHWDISVMADGGAKLGFKIGAGGKVDGKVTLNKSEWSNVIKTVEDSKDYRECAKKLMPIVLKSLPQTQEAEKKTKKRVLGGISWQRYVDGVNIKLKSCVRKGETVECQLQLRAEDKDIHFGLFSYSVIFDQRGHSFETSQTGIADKLGRNTSKLLIKGIDTNAFIRFSGVTPNSKLISMMRLSVATGSSKTVEFRDVKINIE